MDLVVMVLVCARQESQVSQEAPDPRDQQVLRVHPAHKDPWAQEAIKVTMANLEAKVPQVPRDLKDLPVQRDNKESKVTQVTKESKDLQEH